MFSSTNDPNLDITILDEIADKVNLTYISKFELPLIVAQYINSCLIFNDIHINDSITASDIKLNL